jgi:hypothetical protein
MADDEWKRVTRKTPKKQPVQKPKRFYWLGFDNNGNESWYVEFANGVVLSDKDPSYAYWHRKYYPIDIK